MAQAPLQLIAGSLARGPYTGSARSLLGCTGILQDAQQAGVRVHASELREQQQNVFSSGRSRMGRSRGAPSSTSLPGILGGSRLQGFTYPMSGGMHSITGGHCHSRGFASQAAADRAYSISSMGLASAQDESTETCSTGMPPQDPSAISSLSLPQCSTSSSSWESSSSWLWDYLTSAPPQPTRPGVSLSEAAAASIAEAAAVGASGQPHPTIRISVFRDAADLLQSLHDASGLPWWAVIPLTTLTLRLALLPVSMFQAKAVRTNYLVYREAVGLTDKQLGLTDTLPLPGSARASSGSLTSATSGGRGGGGQGEGSQQGQKEEQQELSSEQRLRRGKLVLGNFALLRKKLGAPHPLWILLNPLIQVPAFVVTGMTLRQMGASHWPGFAQEGALWFPDLTQVALTPALDGSYLTPMGPQGFFLPLTIFGMTLTSLWLGFGAAAMRAGAAGGAGLAGPRPADDWIGKLLPLLPPFLLTMAVVNLWVKLGLAHAALLHWTTSTSFTLALQLALKRPAFRTAFNLPSPKELQEALSRLSNQRLQQLGDAAGALAPSGRGYIPSELPPALVKQVTAEASADVLVIMGAQHSAQKRYKEALYCLDKALQIDGQHVRAHYSRGQVFSLANRWLDAEACFQRARELASNPAEKGQATYCVATALHTQGKPEAAVPMYREAAELWPVQAPVVAFSLARALAESGRLEEALQCVAQALSTPAMQAAGPRAPFKQPLQDLQSKLEQLREQRQQQLLKAKQAQEGSDASGTTEAGDQGLGPGQAGEAGRGQEGASGIGHTQKG